MKQLVFTFLVLLSITKVYSQTEVELKLKLNKGDSYLIENNIVSITEQDIMGEKQIIKKNEFSSFFFTVLNQTNVNSYLAFFANYNFSFAFVILAFLAVFVFST